MGLLVMTGCFSLKEQQNPHLIDPPGKPTAIRTIPHTFALGLLSGRSTSEVTMRAFNTGVLKTRGEAVSSLKSYNAKVRLDVPAFLIKHSEEGYVLFGTGLSPKAKHRPSDSVVRFLKFLASFDYTFRYNQKKDRDLLSQIKKEGISPSEIRWVVVPYWGAEIVGMLESFPEATVLVSRREWEWKISKRKRGSPPGPLDPIYFEGKINVKLLDMHNQPAFGAFENGLDIFKDGSIILVGLPGRTPGNIGAWINLDGGPVLLTGGATYVVDNYLDLALPVKGKFTDLEEYWQSLHVISAMRKGVPQLIVLPGNDLAPLSLVTRTDIRRFP